jgi:hypothetical protein
MAKQHTEGFRNPSQGRVGHTECDSTNGAVGGDGRAEGTARNAVEGGQTRVPTWASLDTNGLHASRAGPEAQRKGEQERAPFGRDWSKLHGLG